MFLIKETTISFQGDSQTKGWLALSRAGMWLPAPRCVVMLAKQTTGDLWQVIFPRGLFLIAHVLLSNQPLGAEHNPVEKDFQHLVLPR